MQKEMAKMGLENVRRLDRLIDSLLDISKMEAGVMPLDLGECDLAELLAETAEEYSLLGTEAGIEVRCGLPDGHIKCYCDQDKLLQVLANLSSNALKFTPKGGTIIFSLERWEGQALFRVENTGAGIAPEDLHKLFGKFAKLNSPGGAGAKGTGLGLAISRGIMEMHGGRIWAESEPGKYCRFFILLPLRDFREAALMLAKREIAAAAGKSEFCTIALSLPGSMKAGACPGEAPADAFCLRLKDCLRSAYSKITGGRRDLVLFLPDCGLKDCTRHFYQIQRELEGAGLKPEEAASCLTAMVYPSDFHEPETLAEKLAAPGERQGP